MVERAYPHQYLEGYKQHSLNTYTITYVSDDFIKGFLVGLALGIGISALIIAIIALTKK